MVFGVGLASVSISGRPLSPYVAKMALERARFCKVQRWPIINLETKEIGFRLIFFLAPHGINWNRQKYDIPFGMGTRPRLLGNLKKHLIGGWERLTGLNVP